MKQEDEGLILGLRFSRKKYTGAPESCERKEKWNTTNVENRNKLDAPQQNREKAKGSRWKALKKETRQLDLQEILGETSPGMAIVIVRLSR